MQRRSSVLLLKRAIRLAPKRPLDGMGGGSVAAAAAAAATAPSSHPAPPPPPPHPRQAPAATPQATLRPAANLVTPPASAQGASNAGAATTAAPTGLRKKKIIRRIVKKKKLGHHSASAASSSAAAAAAAPTAAAAAQPASRAQTLLSEIRKQPEVPPQMHSAAAAEAAEEAEEAEEHVDAPAAAAEEAMTAASQTEAVTEDNEEKGEVAAAEESADTAEYTQELQELHDGEESADASTAASSRKTAMVKGFRIDEVGNLCSPSDAMFARRLPSGGCQFFAWPGTPLPVASKAIMTMPDTIRTVHAVFGRPGTPIDIVMDIDCQVPQEYWTMTKIRPFQQKLLDDVLSVLKEEIEKIGETIESQVVLQSPNLKKASFHVHTKIKDAAFADFNSLHGFLSKFQDRLPNVDMQIYRPNGMLRMFSCMKENHTSAMIVFDDPKWNIGFPGGKVSDEEAALHSVCVRDPSTFTRTLTFASPRSFQSANAAAAGEGAEAGQLPPQVRLPLTEREAVLTASRWLRAATEVEVGEWRSWIGLGLCAYRLAYHFRNAKNLPRPAMEEMLDAWTEASRKCPLKFHQGECQTRWANFSPDKLGDHSDWWGAYKRLGRLEAAVAEARMKDAEVVEKRQQENARWAKERAAAVAAAAAAPSTPSAAVQQAEDDEAAPAAKAPAAAEERSGAAHGVPSASRKLKLKKRSLRR